MKKVLFGVLLIGIIIVLTACGSSDSKDYSNMSTKEIIKDITENSYDFSASATGSELIITQNGNEEVYKMPTNEFYVSFAPYVYNTHT